MLGSMQRCPTQMTGYRLEVMLKLGIGLSRPKVSFYFFYFNRLHFTFFGSEEVSDFHMF